jgi:hypothetical protein
VLRVAQGVRWESGRSLAGRRCTLVVRREPLLTVHGSRWRRWSAEQQDRPLPLVDEDERTLWWYADRLWWARTDLDDEDVAALVGQRDAREARRLEHAHALRAAGGAAVHGRRTAIPADVKRAVWQRDGARCVECGGAELLEYDHVIPVALGGATTLANLQLLCGPCNRAKGERLA